MKTTTVWRDDFTHFDYTRWECEVNAFGGGNNELQLYTDRCSNVRVAGGELIITARREKVGIQGAVRDWTSGRVRTKRRGEWTYGLFEADIRLPIGKGLWPAFWLLPTFERYGAWAASGEVDIMEANGKQGFVSGAIHFGGEWPNNRHVSEVLRERIDVTDWHTYGLLKLPDKMVWMLDGRPVGEVHSSVWSPTGSAAPFDQPYHIVLNLAVGGNFPGSPDATTPDEAEMRVSRVEFKSVEGTPAV